MKRNTYTPPPLTLTEGYYSVKQYTDYKMMSQSINNWKQLCPYRLRPGDLSGEHKVLQLHSMQVTIAQRNGATMHNAGSAKECITIGTIEHCADKVCFGQLKLQAGDILIFDDDYPHNFIANDTIHFASVTIRKSSLGSRRSMLFKALNKCIKDTDAHFAATLHEIWKRFTESFHETMDRQNYQEAEEEILDVIIKLLDAQIPAIPKLTAGEKIALKIRDQVIQHMDGNVSIGSLATEYGVSEQTLQNSFKSLFGFTPKKFLRLLKLNIVQHELKEGDPVHTKVSDVASKWGFRHMGRFSFYYTELFGENPSATLKTFDQGEDDIENVCVSRQEEII